MIYIVPAIIILAIVWGTAKRVSVFDCFIQGSNDTLALLKSMLPYLVAIFIAIELFRASGLSALFADWLSTPLGMLGVPSELVELIVLKPISGSGSLVALEAIYAQYGADSYIGRVASVLSSSSDTIIYIVAIYFSTLKDKKSGPSIPIALAATMIGTVIGCFVCKVV